MKQEVFSRPIYMGKDTKVCMKVLADKEKYEFYFAVEDEELECIGSASTRFLCVEGAGKCFTGTVMGLYTCCDQKTEAVLRIREWEMQ